MQTNATTGRAIVWRSVLTLLLFMAYGFVNNLIYPIATIAAGNAAGGQFANEDGTAIVSTWGVNFIGHIGWPFVVYIALLIWVWYAPLRRAIEQAALPVILGLMTLAPQPADAYYDKQDWPEIYFILPNESAFWIPDMGANKDSQKQFMSEQYLNDNKIAAKRFQVPHVQLPKSSWTADFYVPAGRLIIVDRTPYARAWTADPTTGTNKANESFKCQSKGGQDITVGIAISAAVMEENAPRFLYRFGVLPPVGDRNTDQVKFQSVYYGQSLTGVMDTVVKGKVQSLLCGFFSPKTVDEINANAAEVAIEAEKLVKEYLMNNFGITLDYIGWGDTFEFDHRIQQALDDRFIAEKLAPVLGTMEKMAQIRTQEAVAQAVASFGKGIEGKGLPSNMIVIPSNIGDIAASLLGGAGIAKAAPAKPAVPTQP